MDDGESYLLSKGELSLILCRGTGVEGGLQTITVFVTTGRPQSQLHLGVTPGGPWDDGGSSSDHALGFRKGSLNHYLLPTKEVVRKMLTPQNVFDSSCQGVQL